MRLGSVPLLEERIEPSHPWSSHRAFCRTGIKVVIQIKIVFPPYRNFLNNQILSPGCLLSYLTRLFILYSKFSLLDSTSAAIWICSPDRRFVWCSHTHLLCVHRCLRLKQRVFVTTRLKLACHCCRGAVKPQNVSLLLFRWSSKNNTTSVNKVQSVIAPQKIVRYEIFCSLHI